MSAFVVDRAHVDALVAVAVRGPSDPVAVSPDTVWHGLHWQAGANPVDSQRMDYDCADRVGAMLWSENVRSVEARYPDTADSGQYPGTIGFELGDIAAYAWPMSTRRITAVQALKALDCYEYQSCEHAGWTASDAYRFCEALRRALIGHVPGYREAAWSIEPAEL